MAVAVIMATVTASTTIEENPFRDTSSQERAWVFPLSGSILTPMT
jgi:hypothetical protein